MNNSAHYSEDTMHRPLGVTELMPLVQEAQRQQAETRGDEIPSSIDRQMAHFRTTPDVQAAIKKQFQRVESGSPLHRRLVGSSTTFKLDTSGRR